VRGGRAWHESGPWRACTPVNLSVMPRTLVVVGRLQVTPGWGAAAVILKHALLTEEDASSRATWKFELAVVALVQAARAAGERGAEGGRRPGAGGCRQHVGARADRAALRMAERRPTNPSTACSPCGSKHTAASTISSLTQPAGVRSMSSAGRRPMACAAAVRAGATLSAHLYHITTAQSSEDGALGELEWFAVWMRVVLRVTRVICVHNTMIKRGHVLAWRRRARTPWSGRDQICRDQAIASMWPHNTSERPARSVEHMVSGKTARGAAASAAPGWPALPGPRAQG
jgi:hypothetical protein